MKVTVAVEIELDMPGDSSMNDVYDEMERAYSVVRAEVRSVWRDASVRRLHLMHRDGWER